MQYYYIYIHFASNIYKIYLQYKMYFEFYRYRRQIYSELIYLLVYSNSVRVSLVGEETNSVWNLVSLWVHGWVRPDWYKYPEYCAQPKHLTRLAFKHSIEKGIKLHYVTKWTISTNTRRLPWSLFYWFLGYGNVSARRIRGKLKSERWSAHRLRTGQLSCYCEENSGISLWFWIGSTR